MAQPTTVDAYLAALPADRREAIGRVRDVINANLPAGYAEGIQYGMPCWHVPRERYPDTYNGQPLGILSLAAQKSHNALYMMSIYGDPALEVWFKKAYAAAGKKLDMGKSCVRFRAVDDLPLDVIGEAVRRVPLAAFLARYEAVKPPKKPAAKTASKSPSPSKSPSQSKSKSKSKSKSR